MAGKRWDCITPRPKNDGTSFWVRIGSAFQNDNGKIMVYLDAYPLPDKEGVCKILLSEPRDSRPQAEPQNTRPLREAIDDDVPF
jgi:hypothetical protein